MYTLTSQILKQDNPCPLRRLNVTPIGTSLANAIAWPLFNSHICFFVLSLKVHQHWHNIPLLPGSVKVMDIGMHKGVMGRQTIYMSYNPIVPLSARTAILPAKLTECEHEQNIFAVQAGESGILFSGKYLQQYAYSLKEIDCQCNHYVVRLWQPLVLLPIELFVVLTTMINEWMHVK